MLETHEMQKRSWIILCVCLFIAAALGIFYLETRGGSGPLTQEQAIEITQNMERAFRAKNANGILAYMAPSSETRIAGVSQDQLRLLLVRYFRNSNRVSADLNNYAFSGGDTDATLQFDLTVHNDGTDSRSDDYKGHITVHLRRVEVPRLLGLYQAKEWRITGAESTGADLGGFGD
jgi:hypothetical protein